MDPHSLAAPPNPLGYPTPFWFIEFFKVLGFSLHMAPMNLWYAGTVTAVVLGLFGRGHAKTVGHNIARALPFALALGINFGVIPLLFIQVAYYQVLLPRDGTDGVAVVHGLLDRDGRILRRVSLSPVHAEPRAGADRLVRGLAVGGGVHRGRVHIRKRAEPDRGARQMVGRIQGREHIGRGDRPGDQLGRPDADPAMAVHVRPGDPDHRRVCQAGRGVSDPSRR